MTSYFEQLFKQMFIQRLRKDVKDTNEVDDEQVKVTKEYRKILDKVAIGMIYDTFENEKLIDAMLRLSRVQRIIIAFNVIAEIELAEISFLLDAAPESTYSQKSKALKRLNAELENIS